jgi:tetratricopeptide (TPR) repeat protein
MLHKISIMLLLLFSAASIQAQKPDQKLWQEAMALAKAGKHPAALDKYQTALKLVKDQNLFWQAASILQQTGAKDEPLKLYSWGRKTLKSKKAFARELAEIYSAQLSYSLALPEWAAVFETQPDYARIKIEEIAPVFGYLPSARLLEEAGESGKGDWQALLCGLYLRGADFNRAWENCKKIPDNKVSGLVLKKLVNAPGLSPGQAMDFVEDHISRNPPDMEYWQYRLAALLAQDGQIGKAEKVYRSIKGGPAGLYLARLLLEQSRKPEDALEVIKLKQGTWPDSLRSEGAFLKARCFFSLDQPDSSRAIYLRMGDSTQPLKVRQPALFFLGEQHLMTGDLDGAMGSYRQAAALGSDNDVVNDALARLLLISDCKTDKMDLLQGWAKGFKFQSQFKYPQAEMSYNQVIQSDTSGQLADLALSGLAEIAVSNQDHKKAAEYWGRIFSSSKDSLLAAEACYQRGLLLRDRLSDPKRALKNWEEGIIKYSATSWADLMREEMGRGKAAKH